MTGPLIEVLDMNVLRKDDLVDHVCPGPARLGITYAAVNEVLLRRRRAGPVKLLTRIARNAERVEERLAVLKSVNELLWEETDHERPCGSPLAPPQVTAKLLRTLGRLRAGDFPAGRGRYARAVDRASQPYKQEAAGSPVPRIRPEGIKLVREDLRAMVQVPRPQCVAELTAKYFRSHFLTRDNGSDELAAQLQQCRSAHLCGAIAAFADNVMWADDGGERTRRRWRWINDSADQRYIIMSLLPGCRLRTRDQRAKEVYELAEEALALYLQRGL